MTCDQANRHFLAMGAALAEIPTPSIAEIARFRVRQGFADYGPLCVLSIDRWRWVCIALIEGEVTHAP